MVGIATAVCCAQGPPNPNGLCTGNDTGSQSVGQSVHRWSHVDAPDSVFHQERLCIKRTVLAGWFAFWQQSLLQWACSFADAERKTQQMERDSWYEDTARGDSTTHMHTNPYISHMLTDAYKPMHFTHAHRCIQTHAFHTCAPMHTNFCAWQDTVGYDMTAGS